MRRIRRLGWFLGLPLALAALIAVAFWTQPVSFFQRSSELRMYLAGARSFTTTVDGFRVHYYAMGPKTGQPVVLVHGLGARAEDWQNLAPYLARAGYRVYLPDLPGYGQSEKPVNFSYSVPDQAAVVLGFLDVLGLKEVDLGGWSMGGWIVQWVAIDNPARVRKLLLFDSAGIYEVPKWDTGLFTPATPTQLDQLDALLMPNPPRVPGFVAEDILRHSERNAWVIKRALASMLTGHYTTDGLLPKLRMPVLIVWGSEDHITPVSQAEKIHSLVPQSQLDVVSGCGHLAPSQCVAPISPRVIAFLGQ